MNVSLLQLGKHPLNRVNGVRVGTSGIGGTRYGVASRLALFDAVIGMLGARSIGGV